MHSRARSARGWTGAAVAIASLLLAGACASAYYGTLEKFGIEKRHVLVDRVEDAQEAQKDAKKQFESALEQYRSVGDVDAGELEKTYDRMRSEFDRSTKRANAVAERIDEVESVANRLFKEWEKEINLYSDADLKKRSQALYAETRSEYKQLLRAMRKAESTMEPVLTLFQDQVLFLRHNLNARAIGSLETELGNIEKATMTLIEEMERSIDEAGRFIASMS
jgi:hypothetical protein